MDRTNRNTALATALVEELARSGLTDAVISPGSRSTPLALALWRSSSINCRVVLDERCAGFVALGIALATGRPAAVTCTSGSAAANLHPAVVEADEAGVPMVLLTADRPPELRGIGAGQAIDQIKLFGDSVRWFCEAGSHEADDTGLLFFRTLGCRAWAEAIGINGRPGPIHINLPWRDPLGPEPVDGDVTATDPLALEGRLDRPLTAWSAASGASPEALADAVERIRASSRGLIIAGRLPHRGLSESIASLAAALGWPILAEPTSQLRFGPHSRDLLIEHYDTIARSQPSELDPDLVLRIGDMPTSKPLRAWINRVAGLEQVVLDPPGRWNEPSGRATAILRGDLSLTIQRLAEGLRDSAAADSWSQAWKRANAASEAGVTTALDELGSDGVISEPALHRALGQCFEDGEQVMVASSMPIRDHEAFGGTSGADVGIYSNRGANGIDGTVSTAVGLATATRRPTWVVLGDLALAHDIGGLANIAATPTVIRIIVINNGGGGIFGFLPQASQIDAAEFETLFGTPSGLRPKAIAATFELDYRAIQSLDDLAKLPDDRSFLAEVVTDRKANVAAHESIVSAAAKRLPT